MITVEELLALRDAIPLRRPRGDPRNKERCKPGHAFGVALDQFEREHGISWFDYRKEMEHAAR